MTSKQRHFHGVYFRLMFVKPKIDQLKCDNRSDPISFNKQFAHQVACLANRCNDRTWTIYNYRFETMLTRSIRVCFFRSQNLPSLLFIEIIFYNWNWLRLSRIKNSCLFCFSSITYLTDKSIFHNVSWTLELLQQSGGHLELSDWQMNIIIREIVILLLYNDIQG